MMCFLLSYFIIVKEINKTEKSLLIWRKIFCMLDSILDKTCINKNQLVIQVFFKASLNRDMIFISHPSL